MPSVKQIKSFFLTLTVFSFFLSLCFVLLCVSLNFSDCSGMRAEGCYINLFIYSLFLRFAFLSGIGLSAVTLIFHSVQIIQKRRELK